jgi:hypothetical protein
MKIRVIFFSIFFLFSTVIVKSQPCLQPGSLVSVFNLTKGKYEYLVFKFVNPYNSKGQIAQGNSNLFGPLSKKGNTYHKITFTNISNFCTDKWILNLPQKKILDLKTPEMANGTVVYQFELAEGAKIVSHISYRHQIYYFVKIRIE